MYVKILIFYFLLFISLIKFLLREKNKNNLELKKKLLKLIIYFFFGIIVKNINIPKNLFFYIFTNLK